MTFYQRLLILAAANVLLVVAVLWPRRVAKSSPIGTAPRSEPLLTALLAVVAAALILVGVVSGSVLRHVIQVAPLVAALILLLRRSPWGATAALPLFAFWFVIMGAIWLFLLGLARVLTGSFSPAEIVLTIVIGVASAIGLGAVYWLRRVVSIAQQILPVIVFALLQWSALLLSVQPFANR